jgi:hypothetical protein
MLTIRTQRPRQVHEDTPTARNSLTMPHHPL